MHMMMITRSKMKPTTPPMMATQSQMSTGAFSVKHYWQQKCYTFYWTCITLSTFLSLSLTILMTAQQMSASSRFSRVHMSISHCPSISLQGWTEKMDEEAWDGNKEQDEQFHFTSRSEVCWCPNVHVRFTLWPSYTRDPPEEETNRRRNLERINKFAV